MKKLFLFVLIFLSGCMTLTLDKTTVVQPSGKTTVVTAHAVAHCQDWFFVEHCTMNVTLDSQQ
jgi:hypothetical protein